MIHHRTATASNRFDRCSRLVVALFVVSVGASCNAPTEPGPAWRPIDQAPEIIRTFATEQLPLVDTFAIVVHSSDLDATIFTVQHSLAQGCPLCFRYEAAGLLIDERIGWVEVDGTYLLPDSTKLRYFDVLSEDGRLITEELIGVLGADPAPSLLFALLLMFTQDPDTPESALVTIASSLESRPWTSIGEALLENETARQSCAVLEQLAELEDFVYATIRAEARAALDELISQNRCLRQ